MLSKTISICEQLPSGRLMCAWSGSPLASAFRLCGVILISALPSRFGRFASGAKT
jgi:hypothetical protein